jgi:integrase/recombinase XerD
MTRDPNEFRHTHVPGFFLEMKRQFRSPATIKTYRVKLRALLCYCEAHDIVMDEITEDQLDAFQDALVAKRQDSQTIRVTMTAIRKYHHFKMRKRLRSDDPTINLAIPRYRAGAPRPMSLSSFELVFASASARVRICLALAFFVGLRCQSIANISIQDIDLDSTNPRILVHGKGGVNKWLPLIAEAVDEIRLFLATLPPQHRYRGPLIRNIRRRPNERASENWVSKYCNLHLADCGIADRMHSIRHTFGTLLIEMGVDSRIVQRLMLHANLTSTQVYTDVSDPLMRDAIEKLPRPALPKSRRHLAIITEGASS